jgi:hypothetical protein
MVYQRELVFFTASPHFEGVRIIRGSKFPKSGGNLLMIPLVKA